MLENAKEAVKRALGRQHARKLAKSTVREERLRQKSMFLADLIYGVSPDKTKRGQELLKLENPEANEDYEYSCEYQKQIEKSRAEPPLREKLKGLKRKLKQRKAVRETKTKAKQHKEKIPLGWSI